MKTNQNQLAFAIAAELPVKITKISKSKAMKTAWALRKEAAVRLGCRIHDVLMTVCLKMAYRLETFLLGEVKMGTKLSGREFRKAVKAAIGYSDETMHEITIRETNTQKQVDGKLLKKCFISIEMLGRKAPKGLMASMLWSGDFSDIEEVWLEEIKDKEQDMEFYVLKPEHIASIVSAMKGHHCGCSSIIGMAIGIEFNTNFIELLK